MALRGSEKDMSIMRNKSLTGKSYLSFVAIVAIAGSLLLAVPLAGASSPPSPPPIPANAAAWAYGKSWSWNDSEISSLAGNSTITNTSFSESGSVTVGLEVIYVETNTSVGENVNVYAALTVDAQVTASYQATSTSGYTVSESASISASGYYVINDTIDFTNSGAVTLSNGTVAPALGVLSAVSTAVANLTASFTATASESGNGLSASYSANGYVGAGAGENSSVTFTPALGLVPFNPQPGETWGSTAAYSGDGNLWDHLHEFISEPKVLVSNGTGSGGCPTGYTSSGNNCDFSYTVGQSASLLASGLVTLIGEDVGTINLPATTAGQVIPAQEVNITTSTGYGFTEGLIIVPSALASVGTSGSLLETHPLASSTSVSGDEFDYETGAHNHAGAVASNDGTLGNEALQAQPQSPQTAEATAQSNLNTVQGHTGGASGTPFMIVIVIAMVAVVGIAAAVIWAGRKRRRQPPTDVRSTPWSSQAYPAQPYYAPNNPPPPPSQKDPVGVYWQNLG